MSGGGGRRTVASKGGASSLTLDDRPLQLVAARGGKRVIVCLPYEVWIVNASTLEAEKTIELTSPRPTVFEAEEDGVLWIGGTHLHRGSLFSGAVTKVGTKLGGVVDHVCVVRPRLLCTAGSQGEVLWDTEQEEAVHRRKASEHPVLGLIASPDGRAVWIDGAPHAWVVDPDHPSGYMKLKLKATSSVDVESEGIGAIGSTPAGRCLFATDDGGVAWTNRALRIEGERFCAEARKGQSLAVAGDDRWVYALRSGNVLQRFLIAQPPEPESGDAPAPLPEAQTIRLERVATAIAVLGDGRLALAGPQSDGQLGRLWLTDAEALEWQPLALGSRRLVDAEESPAPAEAPKKPDFTQVRSKISGPPIAELQVDDVIGGAAAFWVTRGQGQPLERPTTSMNATEVLAADALILPAMFRLQEGTARPGLVVWPGAAAGRPVDTVTLLTWGDEPRQWVVLDTPSIRKQGWSRRGVFPLQVAMAHALPEVAGRRPRLPGRWVDAELFGALAKECKKLLKVLW